MVATMIMSKCGFVLKTFGNTQETETDGHAFNWCTIEGEPYYIDYCWNVPNSDKPKYLFVEKYDMNNISCHKKPCLGSYNFVLLQYNANLKEQPKPAKPVIKKIDNSPADRYNECRRFYQLPI